MNILLIEDHRLVADALKIMLETLETDINIVACYSTQHAFSMLDSGKKFELVLTNLFMPGIDGIGFIVGLKSRRMRVPVVIICGSDDDKYIYTAIENGAAGFVPKSLPGAEMLSGLKHVLAGGRFFPKRFTAFDREMSNSECKSGFRNNSNSNSLGQKQVRVLKLLAHGNSNKQISTIVGISEATVKYHTSQLFKLLGVKNRTSCVREAQQRGLIGEQAL